MKYIRSHTYPTGELGVASPEVLSVKIETVEGKRVMVIRVRQAREQIGIRAVGGWPPRYGVCINDKVASAS